MSLVKIQGNASGTGIFTIAAPATNTDRTLTLPDVTGTVVTSDASGNVGIGTSSPTRSLTIYKTSAPILQLIDATSGTTQNDGLLIQQVGVDSYIENGEAGFMQFRTSATERVRITAAGLLQFNNGYGSVATAYGCRAWVNFNGTGTVAIRASGNVSSITDNGTGDYTINFTTAMPDVNYSVTGAAESPDASSGAGRFSLNSQTAQTASAVRVFTGYQNTSSFNVAADNARVCVAIFR